jgi:hypothetical protein
MKNCINWGRIIAVAGLTFCTTLVSTGYQTMPAIINAGLISGIALFTELKFESEGMEKIQRAINKAVVL